jgi:hypothetical protein
LKLYRLKFYTSREHRKEEYFVLEGENEILSAEIRNDWLYNSVSSPYVLRVTKSKGTIGVWLVACRNEIISAYRVNIKRTENMFLDLHRWILMERCKVWGSLSGDCEECRLLGNKNPVRTLRGTHYLSATEPSRLMLCNIWGFHGGDYEECRLLWYKNPVRTLHETRYVSATEPSLLRLCKILSFHGSDYEVCCLLGYKNPVLTLQETRYISATEPSRLIVCKI